MEEVIKELFFSLKWLESRIEVSRLLSYFSLIFEDLYKQQQIISFLMYNNKQIILEVLRLGFVYW